MTWVADDAPAYTGTCTETREPRTDSTPTTGRMMSSLFEAGSYSINQGEIWMNMGFGAPDSDDCSRPRPRPLPFPHSIMLFILNQTEKTVLPLGRLRMVWKDDEVGVAAQGVFFPI